MSAAATSTPQATPRTPLLHSIPSLPLPPLRLLPLAAATSRGEYHSSGSRDRILSSRDQQGTHVSTARVFSHLIAAPNSDAASDGASARSEDVADTAASVALPSPTVAALAATVTKTLGGKGFHEGIVVDGSPTLHPSISPLAAAAVAQVHQYQQQHPAATGTPADLAQAATRVAIKAYDQSRTTSGGTISTVYPAIPAEQIASRVQQKTDELLQHEKESQGKPAATAKAAASAAAAPIAATKTVELPAREATAPPDKPVRAIKRNTLVQTPRPVKRESCCIIL